MSGSPYKLYGRANAGSMAPQVVLEEIGAPYELRQIDPSKGDNQTDAYQKIHPRGHVPALVQGDFVLIEAHAIMVHLADQNPGARLMPSPGSRERARVHELAGILASAVHVGYRQVRRPNRFTDEESAFAGIQKHGRAYMSRLFAELDARLQGPQWAVGEQYTVVDPYLTIFNKWGYTAELDMEKYPSWNAHSRRVRERPAVQRVIAQEELPVWP